MLTLQKQSFDAVVDERTRVVVLGSLPGEISLQRGEYYANPTNQFWRLIGSVVGHDLVELPYRERLARLRDSGIGLWDVVKTADRSGSLDSAIRNHQANTLHATVDRLPALRALAFNGAKSAAIGRKQMGSEASVALVSLPSSSAAYCSISFDRKRAEWLRLKEFL